MRTLRAALAVVLLALVLVPASLASAVRRAVTRGGHRPGQEPGGLVLTEQDQPGLWAEVRELAAATATRAPDEIRLVPDVNAAVSEATRPFALGPSIRRMFLGAPLLQGVSRNQLRAVLAHELGHHSTADARVGGLVHRGRHAAHPARSRRCLAHLSRAVRRRRHPRRPAADAPLRQLHPDDERPVPPR